MTARTPSALINPNFGKEPNESKAENSNIIDYNGPNTNKAGINHSPAGGNTTGTTSIENKQVNRGYRHIPTDNYSALFDIEYYHPPFIKKKEIKDKELSNDKTPAICENITENRKESELESVKDGTNKIESEENRNRDLEKSWKQGIEDMAYEQQRMDQLEIRNKQHSAQIHELDRQLKNIRMENDRIKGQFVGHEGRRSDNGFTDRVASYGNPERNQSIPNYQPEPRYSEFAEDPYGQPGRPQYKNEQHRIAHRHGGAEGEEPYWGFNKIYNPQYVTAYRREHIPFYAKMEERDKQTQYADDYNYLQEMQRRQEEEWRRKQREQEELFMKDKPKTYDYTAQYQAKHPPRDINKYFHDSKYLNERPEEKPDDYYFGEYAPFKQNPGTGLSTYERAYVSPRYGSMMQKQTPGGLYIIRFEDSGYSEVIIALRKLQTILKSTFGHILGVARKQNVYPIDGDPEWRFSKGENQRHTRIRLPIKNVENAIAVIWFPSREKAHEFFITSFNNRFHDHNFPTPHSFEGHYIPLLSAPILKSMNTYLVIELLNAKRFYPEDLQKFQGRTTEAILNYTNNCLPFIASAIEGREAFKPGTLFKDRSKVFISRFESMVDLSELWLTQVIQNQLSDCGLAGPRNVWAFSLQDWED